MANEAHDAGTQVLVTSRLVPPFAVVLALAALLGRGIAPSAVGTVSWAEVLLLIDAFVAQLVAMASAGLCAALLVGTAMAPRSPGLRVALVTMGALCLLVALSAAGVTRVPRAALVMVTGTSAAVAILSAVTGARRLPEVALGLAGVGAAARLIAVHLANTGRPLAAWVLASVAFALELGVLGAVAAFALRAPRRGAVAVGVATVAGALAAWVVVAQPDGPALGVVRHAVERLAPRPHPFGAAVLPSTVAVMALTLAIGLCLARRADRAVVGALAMILVVRTHADVPLLGIALTAAALALFLTGDARRSPDRRPAAEPTRGSSPQPAATSSSSTERLAAGRGVG